MFFICSVVPLILIRVIGFPRVWVCAEPVFQLPQAKARSLEARIHVCSGSEHLAPFPSHLYCFRQDMERMGFMFISNSYWAAWARRRPGHRGVTENGTSEDPHPLGADILGRMFTRCLPRKCQRSGITRYLFCDGCNLVSVFRFSPS